MLNMLNIGTCRGNERSSGGFHIPRSRFDKANEHIFSGMWRLARGLGEGLTGGNKLDMETLVHSFLDINVICSEPRYKHEISISNLHFNCATATVISTRCMVTPVVYNGYPLCFGGRLSVVMLWCFLSLKEL